MKVECYNVEKLTVCEHDQRVDFTLVGREWEM